MVREIFPLVSRSKKMQSEAERTLNNLRVLAALSHNDKLMTNDDAFDIHVPTTLRALIRTWYGERRGQNVQRIRQTLRAAMQFASKTLEESNSMLRTHTNDDAAMKCRLDTMVLQHFRMVDALTKAKQGLLNLIQTYREDAALSSQIELLTEEVDDFMRVVQPHTKRLLLTTPVPVCVSPNSGEAVPSSSSRSPSSRLTSLWCHPPDSLPDTLAVAHDLVSIAASTES